MVPSLWPMDERPFGMNNLYEKESHSPTKSVVPWTIGCSPDAKKKNGFKGACLFFPFIHSFIHSPTTHQTILCFKQAPLPNAKKPNGREEEEDKDERLQKNQ